MKTNEIPAAKPESDRRNFLVGATLGGAGAVAAVVTVAGGSVAELLPVKVTENIAKPKGYHVTPHILQYYETTRI